MPPKKDLAKMENNKKLIIGSLERMHEFITKVDSKPSQVAELKIRLPQLEQLINRFHEIQSELEIANPDDDSLLNESLNFDEKYYLVKGLFVAQLDLLNESSKQVNRNDVSGLNGSSSDTQHEGQSFQHSLQTSVSLPKLVIPTFTGNYVEWQSFKDLFESVIINNLQLSSVQKFYYLKSSLKGEPLSLIKNISVTNENFSVAWQTLVSRFDNKLATINDHLKLLLDMPIISKSYSLRDLQINIKQNVDSLKNLDVPVDSWDLMIIFLASQKLDPKSKESWELTRNQSSLPNLAEFLAFLDHRSSALELASGTVSTQKPSFFQNKFVHVASLKDKPYYCYLCKTNNHNLYKCHRFLAMSVNNRKQFLRENQICFNCISARHALTQCKASSCRSCSQRHNSLIHTEDSAHTRISQNSGNHSNLNSQRERSVHSNFSENSTSSNVEEQRSRTTMLTHTQPTQVLLSTAVVKVLSSQGKWISARALLDSASEEDFVTNELVQKLGIETTVSNLSVQGISGSKTNVTKSAIITLSSTTMSEYQVDLQCSVLDRITVPLPQVFVDTKQWPLMPNYRSRLADPQFYKPSKIDILIGAKTFYSLMRNKTLHLGQNLPTLTDTVFGWVVSGVTPTSVSCCTSINLHSYSLHSSDSQSCDLSENISKFWRLEELSDKPILSPEDKACEKNFVDTHKRDVSGTYIVDLPLHNNALEQLGSSFQGAYKRFLMLEKRLHANSSLLAEYRKFINEYVELQHARYVPLDTEHTFRYFMPHHAVIKPSSSTTRLRVVFDASFKTSSGKSLNDVMFKGPTLQPELYTILLSFRSYKYVFSADVSKMFRRIKINELHQPFQSILWRDSPTDSLKCLQLTTVTYGTAAAPYLAKRSLIQLANDEGEHYPLAANCVYNHFYMDDALIGADSLSDILNLQSQLSDMLKRGGFELHKWASNCPEVLARIPSDKQELNNTVLTDDKSVIKTLGLFWNPSTDQFQIVVPDLDIRKEQTKREILSSIARFFDPIGLIGPVIIKAKIIMQKIWVEKVDWDEKLPDHLQTEWSTLASELPILKTIRIPRYYFLNDDVTRYELHGFCDASNNAYGACIYVRALYKSNQISVRLVTTKTRVSPLKTVSIPRLELCGALLLAKLIAKVKLAFTHPACIVLWTDSSIVLSWLNASANRWATFVANRISEIQEITSGCSWKHISSEYNPADYLSRGIYPSQLNSLSQYWRGPDWLSKDNSEWPHSNFVVLPADGVPEFRKIHTSCAVSKVNNIELFQNFSKFQILIRVIAWCKRFIYNSKTKENRIHGDLSLEEINESHDAIIRVLQINNFEREIVDLTKNKSTYDLRYSRILNLNPYVDSHGLLRVGGRIKHADVSYAQKHPLILPSKNHVTTLILRYYHEKMFHTGVDNTLANVRLRYWVINGKQEIKKIVHQCVKCFRFNATPKNQMMGDLPKERVSFIRPFYYVGIDFGGPISIRQSRIRSSLISKGYIALFVCMSTKALHIELVSDLSTKSFLAALKRFISRRGKCHTILSDNATNFKGAFNQLNELYKLFKIPGHLNSLHRMTSSEGIKWKFNIPLASHMGGLWEAGIKSVKRLLKKVLGTNILTYEETNTLLIEIEAILNSRPLCSLSDDHDDFSYLSPAHFLIGDSFMSIPDKDLSITPDNRLSYWEKISKLRQQFWSAWYKVYLSSLQQRPKWLTPINNLKIGSLVLVKEDHVPPLNWILARILDLHVGSDGLARSATIKTKIGIFKRPINKLCPLPVSDDQSLIGGEDVRGNNNSQLNQR